MNPILERANELQEIIVKDRRQLHQMAEIGMYLPKTVAYVKKRLDEMKIEWRSCGGAMEEKETRDFCKAGLPEMKEVEGIIATIGSGEPCILLRADMDALPLVEDNNLPFKSCSNASHMCGHDSHTAMLLGAAAILKEQEDQIKGTVKLMFQPGEETGNGARKMVEYGALEGTKIDAAFALHVDMGIPTGDVHYVTGVASASFDTFFLNIKGKGGHSSQPQKTVDPVMIANQIYQALNILVPRETNPGAAVTLTSSVMKGGSMVNIIPESAELHTGFRTIDMDSAAHLRTRIPEIIDHYVKAWGGTYELTTFSTPSTYCDPELCEKFRPFMSEIVGEDHLAEAAPLSGTEDFGYVTSKVPGVYACIGAGTGENIPLHNPRMVLDESVFAEGAALYANIAFSWLKSN